MSLRVESNSDVNAVGTCELNPDIAMGGQPPNTATGEENVCTATAPDGADPLGGLTSLMGQVQVRSNTVDGLKAQAKAAGLTQAEVDSLGEALSKFQGQDFNRETTLVRNALSSDNPARALRTYLDLAPMRTANPNRITPEITRALVMGVGTSATDNAVGHKGVIGRAQAIQCAQALTRMTPADLVSVNTALQMAGRGGDKWGSPDTERALILKGVAARATRFPQPTPYNIANGPSAAAKEVTDFAAKIRGDHRAFLVGNTEVLGLTNPTQALEQRWNDSCGPTTVEMTEADNDPVYSYNLNSTELAHSTKPGLVSMDQALTLILNSGVPRARGTAGKGMALDSALNLLAGPITNRTYTTQAAGNTPAARTATMNQMEKLLDQGIDVPIRVAWPGGGAHFQLCTDVQGTAPNRQFLVSDPWNGQTGWISEAAIANGNTNFFAGTGTLSHIYPSTPNP
jgi:Papain-like cysteine protease AvrRpt2